MYKRKILIFGAGYVGLVTGACLAEKNFQVTCVDLNKDKIQELSSGKVSLYEPELSKLVQKNLQSGNIRFKSVEQLGSISKHIIFIAVGTPPLPNGAANTDQISKCTSTIASLIKDEAVVVLKSTSPIGTTKVVRSQLFLELKELGKDCHVVVINNPEFLREGSAVSDFLNPDRVVIGIDQLGEGKELSHLYMNAIGMDINIQYMSTEEAELTKYLSNSMLATRVAFMNEAANLCDKYNMNIKTVQHAVGLDARIGEHYLSPGCGFGGSCLPKDTLALSQEFQRASIKPSLIDTVIEQNRIQQEVLFNKLRCLFREEISNLRVAIWGLAFKPHTDDIRSASSIPFINSCLEAEVQLNLFDPFANKNMQAYLGPRRDVKYFDEMYSTLENCHALVTITEWPDFQFPDWKRVKKIMINPYLIDGRNSYDPKILDHQGIAYWGIGTRNNTLLKVLESQPEHASISV